MRRFGLIGYPIGHSLSPELFRAGYPCTEDTYELIETDSFEEAISLFEQDYDAINVTAPFKEKAFLRADAADEAAAFLQATNLLVKGESGIKAYNTDFTAVQTILRNLARLFSERPRVLVVGCGGAGKAAAYASAMLGFPTKVANRDFAKARAFCESAENLEPARLDLESLYGCGFDILAHTIPLVPECMRNLDLTGRAVVEANYRDPGLQNLCVESGCHYVPGTEWLVEQAAAGFAVMTGKHPDLQKLSKFRIK